MKKKTIDVIINEIPLVLVIIDLEKKIIEWNSKAEEVFGIPRDSVINKTLYEVLPNIKTKYNEYIEVSCIQHGRSIEIQNLKFRHTNSRNFLNGKAKFIPTFQDETVSGAVILIDVFEDGHNYDAGYLGLINSVIQNSKDAVLITKASSIDAPEGPKIIFANPAFYKMSGYKESEVLGRTPRILQGEKSDPEKTKLIRESLKQWKPVRTELTNYTKSGKEFNVELSIVPVKNKNGWYTHWISIQRDTSARVKMVNQLIEYNKNLESLVTQRTREREKLLLANKEEEVKDLKVKAENDALKLLTTKNDLAQRKQRLLSQEMQLAEKDAQIYKLKETLISLKDKSVIEKKDIESVVRGFETEINEEKNWDNFSASFNDIDPHFFKNLAKICKTLTHNDKKHAAYIKLNLSTREVSKILHIEQKSTEMARYRLKKKLNIKSEDSLSNFILTNA